MNGITGPRDAVILYAYLLEVELGYTAEAVDVGPGLGETRPEFTHIYQAVVFQYDPTGPTLAAVVPDGCDAADAAVRSAHPELAASVSTIGPLPDMRTQ